MLFEIILDFFAVSPTGQDESLMMISSYHLQTPIPLVISHFILKL